MPPAASLYQPLTDAVNQATAQGQQLLERQKAEQTGVIDEYAKIRGSQESLTSVYDRYAKEAGLGDLRGGINAFTTESSKVKALLDSLDQDVNSRTTGSFTTEAQRNRMKAAEGDTLRTSLSRLASGLDPLVQAYGLASQDIGARVNLTSQDQDRALEATRMRFEVLPDQFAREITGFNQSKQQELGTLMDKIQYERDITQREWERAQQLAAEEREFARQKQLMQYKAQLDMQGNQFQASLAERIQNALNPKPANRIAGGGAVENFMLDAGLDKYNWNNGATPMVTQRVGNEYITSGTF